jgi:hypothetical protein
MATIAEPHTEERDLGKAGGSNPLDSLVAIRTIAMSAGDLSLSVMQEVTRIMAQEGNSQVKSVQLGIDRLREDGHISAEETKQLKSISRLVLGATRATGDASQSAVQVREIYQAMVISGKGNPVALAIASAATASLSHRQEHAAPAVTADAATITPGSTGAGAVIGGVIGGIIGGLVGGGLGAGLGAAIGAAAGGAIGFCNKAGV